MVKPFAGKYVIQKQHVIKMKEKREHIRLSAIGRENPFSVPIGYFNSFHEVLMKKIDREETQPKRKSIVRALKPALWLAASFLIIVSVIGVAVKYVESWEKTPGQTVAANEEAPEKTMLYLNDWMLYSILDKENNEEKISDEMMEEVLLASVSVYDLFE
jgi:predicted histidine transporter YuiF (NhaC family)